MNDVRKPVPVIIRGRPYYTLNILLPPTVYNLFHKAVDVSGSTKNFLARNALAYWILKGMPEVSQEGWTELGKVDIVAPEQG